MKPVAIFRHFYSEGPGYFATFLDRHSIPWTLIRIDEQEAVPAAIDGFSGLVFMGGPMSVNDPLPWIAQSCALIRTAAAAGLPVLGHCLGGQIIARALGGVITRNPVKEIGWSEVTVADNGVARNWFGDIKNFQAFHWHGETFTLPQGAVHLLSSAYCVNQAWAIGKHLAMQCHVEMTAGMIADWCAVGSDEILASKDSPAVQSASEMQQQMNACLPGMNSVAARLYSHWISGLSA